MNVNLVIALMSSQKSPITFDIVQMVSLVDFPIILFSGTNFFQVFNCISDIAVTYIAAALLHLLVEAPLFQIIDLLFIKNRLKGLAKKE